MGSRASVRVEPALVGIGLYTPAEASGLIGVSSGKIIRWLRGHNTNGRHYEPLWHPQIDLGDGKVYLGFRDLIEVRVANAFIARNLSAQKVRRAIQLARAIVEDDHPLSTAQFRTDGRTVFLQVAQEDGEESLIDLFKSQYAFREVIEPSLRNVDFDDAGAPRRWWPLGKAIRVVVDPARSFGRPIDVESNVPVDILAAAVEAEGSEYAAARAYDVSVGSVRRAVQFKKELSLRKAA